MARFEYAGFDPGGAPVAGEASESSALALKARLEGEGIRLSYIAPLSGGFLTRQRGLGAEDLSLLAEQLASLTASGLPMAPALEALAKDMDRRRLRDAVEELTAQLKEGASLEEALGKQTGRFPPFFLSLVRAGERTGNLPGVLREVSRQADSVLTMRYRFQEMIAYPAMVGLCMAAVLVLMAVYVVPTFERLYGDAGARLPLVTRALFHISQLVQTIGAGGWLVLLAIALGALFGLGLWFRRPRGRRAAEWLKLKCPLLGRLYRLALSARFARCLAILLPNGVPAADALTLSGASTASVALRDAAMYAARHVEQGERLSDALAATGYFRHATCWLLAQGEETSTLESTLHRLADGLEREFARRSRFFFMVLNPVLLGVVSVVVGFVIVGLFGPIFKLSVLV